MSHTGGFLFSNHAGFAGDKALSVSWLKDDKHTGLRLRHFKVFSNLSPFPFWFAC